MKKAIVIENLTKTYGDLKAVDNISFYVEEGSLFALLCSSSSSSLFKFSSTAAHLTVISASVTVLSLIIFIFIYSLCEVKFIY